MPLLGAFVELHPHILVDIALTDAVVDVAAGQADVAVRFGRLGDSALTARKLGENGRVIVASPGCPPARVAACRVKPPMPTDRCRWYSFASDQAGDDAEGAIGRGPSS